MKMPDVEKITKEEVERARSAVKEKLRKLPFGELGQEDWKKPNLYTLVRFLEQSDPDMLSPIEYCTLRAVENGLSVMLAVEPSVRNALQIRYHEQEQGYPAEKLNQEKFFATIYSGYLGATALVSALDEVVAKLDTTTLTGIKGDVRFDFVQENVDDTIDRIVRIYTSPLVEKRDVQIIKDGNSFAYMTHQFFQLMIERCKRELARFPEQLEAVKTLHLDVELDKPMIVSGIEVEAVREQQEILEASYDDVIGNVEVKGILQSLGDHLCLYDPKTRSNPIMRTEKFPRTLNLFAGPGTGKSSLIKAFINQVQTRCLELGIPFSYFIINQAKMDKYVGESTQNYKREFDRIKDPGGIHVGIIDDVDLVLASRDDPDASISHREVLGYTMNQLEGIDVGNYHGNYMLISATNRPDLVDAAMRSRLGQLVREVPGFTEIEHYREFFTRLMFRQGMEVGYVKAEPDHKVWDILAQKSMGWKLNGRDCRNYAIDLLVEAQNFRVPVEVYQQQGEAQSNAIGGLYMPLTPEVLLEKADRYHEMLLKQAELKREAEAKAAADRLYASMVGVRYMEQHPELYPRGPGNKPGK